MYNFNNLEEILRSGVSADEIAQAFTKNLNAAIDAAKPTPMQEAGEELAKAWNRMVDIYLEDHDVPEYLDNKDDLYVNAETATHLFEESMNLLHKLTPLWNLIEELGQPEEPKPCKCEKNPPVLKNTDAKNEFDDFDEAMRKFLKSIGV